MIFHPTPLLGAYLVETQPRIDVRGTFSRTYCKRAFADAGLETEFVQANCSQNNFEGTIRGMHYQSPPAQEVKLVSCIRRSVYDVIVDIRPESPTYLSWFGAELTEENGLAMYVPKGFAHGYQALSDGATVSYLVSEFYTPEAEGGMRFDDPKLNIVWPLAASEVSLKDRAWPLL